MIRNKSIISTFTTFAIDCDDFYGKSSKNKMIFQWAWFFGNIRWFYQQVLIEYR